MKWASESQTQNEFEVLKELLSLLHFHNIRSNEYIER